MSNLWQRSNGKKRYILGIPVSIVIAAVGVVSGYNKLEAKVETNAMCVETNTVHITELNKTPIQVARIEENLQNLNDRFDRSELKQEKVNERFDDKLDNILKAVLK